MLNAVAWAHRAEGFGLSRKVGGTTVPFPGGGTICHDVLMLPAGTAWDVLIAAGGASTPYQGESFVITDPNRPWVAPVDPGVPIPTPIPIPIPPLPIPTPTPPPVPTKCAILTWQGYLSVQPDGRLEFRDPKSPGQPGPWETFRLIPK